MPVLVGILIVGLIWGLIYGIYWVKKEKKIADIVDNVKVNSLLHPSVNEILEQFTKGEELTLSNGGRMLNTSHGKLYVHATTAEQLREYSSLDFVPSRTECIVLYLAMEKYINR